MRFTESKIRRIIKEEAKRAMREGAFPEEVEAVYGTQRPEDWREHMAAAHEEHGSVSSSTMDPTGLVEKYMTDIESLFKRGRDLDDAKLEASDMIDDLCEELRDSLHMWVLDTYHEALHETQDERDMDEDL